MKANMCSCIPLAVLCCLLPAFASGAAHHPLDALEASEITAASAVLRSAGQIDDSTLVASISLEEPVKADVLAWKPGSPIARRAKAVLRRHSTTVEAIVDLGSGKVDSVKEIPDSQPFVTLPEVMSSIEIATADPRMRAGLQKRGITDFGKLFCAPRTVGNYGATLERTRRIVKVDCFDTRGVNTDVFAKPIEGLFATVDLDRKEVLAVTDLGAVPVPGGNSELDPASIGRQRSARPIVQTAPAGSNITMDGSIVHWQKWSFHVRLGIREGVVLSLVNYEDGGRARSILYQGNIAEIFVPYQDPTDGWYNRTYMDEGEYGFGMFSSPLVPGADCPAAAIYLSPVISNVTGGADVLDKRICIFEMSPSEPAWRHYDFVTQALESRPATELVVRYVATVGNYDYLFDWVFDQNGRLTFRAGATGIDSVKGVAAQKLGDPTAAQDTAYGPLVAPGRAGIYHDHFLSLRLDVDVDGTSNMFARDMLVPEKLPARPNRRASIWTTRQVPATTDTEAKFNLSYEHPSMWHVMNMSRKNAMGYPVGYMIHPHGNASMIMDPGDPASSRAQFANYHLWVTPYAPAERYAAGDYPNQSEPGRGLPAWTAHSRDIANQDIVVWYTIGFHHAPSTEDWPVYGLGWHAVTLMPYNFFDRNPALDIPPVQ